MNPDEEYLQWSAGVLDRELQATLIPAADVAAIIGEDPAGLGLLTARRTDGQVGYPAWQFEAGKPLPGLRDVLAAFPRDFHPLDIERVMTTPDEELDGQSPREWLVAGASPARVLAFVDDLGYL